VAKEFLDEAAQFLPVGAHPVIVGAAWVALPLLAVLAASWTGPGRGGAILEDLGAGPGPGPGPLVLIAKLRQVTWPGSASRCA